MPFLGFTPKTTYTSTAKQTLTADGSTVAYTLDLPSTTTGVEVFVNNVRQEPTAAYSVDGTTLTFTSAPANNDSVYVVFQGGVRENSQVPTSNSITSSMLSYPLTTFSSTGIDDNADAVAVTIDSNEKVGIGTTSPDAKLSVATDEQLIARLKSTNTGITGVRLEGIDTSASDAVFVDWFYDAENRAYGFGEGTSSGSLPINSGTTHADILIKDGYVGIGVTDPAERLDVREEKTGGDLLVQVYNTDNSDTTTQTAGLALGPDTRGGTARITAVKENADFSTNAGRDIALTFSSVLNNTPTEYMRLSSAGYVGFGAVAPRSKVTAEDDSISLGDTATSGGTAWNQSGHSHIFMEANNNGFAIGLDGSLNTRVGWLQIGHANENNANALGDLLLNPLGGNVVIGAGSALAKLDVRNGYILTGTGASTAGTKLLAGYYNSSGDEAVTIGTSRSSAALVLGYGVYPSDTTLNEFYSSADNVAWVRGALTIDDELVYRNAASTTTTVGTAVTLTERFRIRENGYVGINTNNPQHLLDVDAGPTSAPTHKGHIRLSGGALTNSGHGGIEFRGSTFGSGYGWRIQTEDPGGQTPLVISSRENSTTWTEIARFRGNAVGGGIAFNGDTTAANALDDYEEGTWTPTLGTGTITSYEANYTKIGNVVHVQIYINGLSDISTAANFVLSLPYASKSGARSSGSIMFRNVDTAGASLVSGVTSDSQLNTYVSSSSSNLYLYVSRNQGSGYITIQHNDFTNSGVDMFMSLTYIAA